MAAKKSGAELRQEAFDKVKAAEVALAEAKSNYAEVLKEHPYETTKQLTNHEIRQMMRKTGVDKSESVAQEKLAQVSNTQAPKK